MDPFASYAKAAHSHVTRPAKFLGAVKTRAEMRHAYDEAVQALHACETPLAVAEWEESHAALITQIHAEHEFFWEGDGDFLGLEREIERAKARVDDRLDFPRWED